MVVRSGDQIEANGFERTDGFGRREEPTAPSKLVKTTSAPLRSAEIVDTVADAVARMSDRIIDCPVNVTVSAGDCDSTGLP